MKHTKQCDATKQYEPTKQYDPTKQYWEVLSSCEAT